MLFASQVLTLSETPAQSANTQTFRNGTAHDQFLASVRALAEYRFLQLHGYQILGNWIVPPPLDDGGSVGFQSLLPALDTPSPRRDVFKLSVNLAANGELFITPERKPDISLRPVNPAQPPSEGTLIFLSPSGQVAEFIALLPSTPQTSSLLQKVRTTTSLEAKFPLMRIRLPSAVETLWPANLSFQRSKPKSLSSLEDTDYFNLKDGVSSAVKLISDALTYKPPPAPSPAIPPSVAAHVTPSGAYHTPPDGITRTSKAVPTAAQTPTINQNPAEDWAAPSRDDEIWRPVGDTRADDEDFNFGNMEDSFELRDEDFNFFDDEPSEEFDAVETMVSDVQPTEEQVIVVADEKPQSMEDVKQEKSPTPAPVVLEAQFVLSPPDSPLRILPSPPPTRRGTFPKIWDHVRLSGNLEKVQDKYRRGGKYWCDDLEEDAVTDDSMSSSSSDDEGYDWVSLNPRKRKRDDDDEMLKHRLNGPGIGGPQSLDSDIITAMIRAIDENLLLLQSPRDDLTKPISKPEEKQIDYANGLDTQGFDALVEIVANQVTWDGLKLSESCVNEPESMAIDDFTSVVMSIWGEEAPNNPGLHDLTEVTDTIPSFEEEGSPQIKTPRMKATKSPHNQNNGFSLVTTIEQTQSIYPIPSPSFLVNRIVNRNPPAPNHIQRLSVSPPALRFWEKFSFSPYAGEKDVRCYVVHPDCEGMSSAVDVFLSEIQTVWETSGMGKFERGKVNADGKDGMISINVPAGADEEVCLTSYQDTLVNFGTFSSSMGLISGRGLSTLPNTWLTNILILMVNPFSNGSAIIPLCRAFLSFKSAFFEGVDNPALIPSSNVALQIVPVSMVARKESVLMRGLEFHSFLRCLYDRCEVMENTVVTNAKPTVISLTESCSLQTRALEFLTSPATLIASIPPTSLTFSDSFPVRHCSLLKDNSTLHLSYSLSSDNRWVTAVWSDDWGHVSLQESYCLARLSSNAAAKSQIQSFESVCAQIWRRTLDIAKQARIDWKVIIVRVGGMSKNEIGIWNALKEGNPPEPPGQIQLLLACIDLNPPLAVSIINSAAVVASPLNTISTPFPSSTAIFSQSSPAAVGNAYGTPVATPLAQANESPDPSGGIMSTPGGTVNPENTQEFDPEARWIDTGDEIWAIVLNHRVPACRDADPEKEIRFGLASGFLWPAKSQIPLNLTQVT